MYENSCGALGQTLSFLVQQGRYAALHRDGVACSCSPKVWKSLYNYWRANFTNNTLVSRGYDVYSSCGLDNMYAGITRKTDGLSN